MPLTSSVRSTGYGATVVWIISSIREAGRLGYPQRHLCLTPGCPPPPDAPAAAPRTGTGTGE